MTVNPKHNDLANELADMLAEALPGVAVDVGHSDRWDRMCVTFLWAGFADLLPEERFQRLSQVIPEAFRNERLGGFVWLELAPDETIDDFLKLPRSEEIADREATVFAGLVEVDFFKSLAKSLGSSPQTNCVGDFSKTAELLSAKTYSAAKISDAKLLAIRLGAYCDCQVLSSVKSALKELPSGTA